MSLSLGLAVLLSAQAATPGEAWVVLTRRSGVTAAQSMELAQAVSARLTEDGVPNTLAVEDLSACGARKPCLIELGRKKKVQAMVLLEVGTVLEDAFARAEAVSVEADGKRLGLAEVEAALDGLATALTARVRTALTPTLKTTLGVEPPVAETPAVMAMPVLDFPAPGTPEPGLTEPAMVEAPLLPPQEQAPVVVAPEPAPTPAPVPVQVVSAPVSKPYFTGAHVVGTILLGLGAATLVGSAVMAGDAATQVGTQTRLCPRGQICEDPAAFTAYQSAVASQNISLMLLGVGGGVAVTGLVLMLIPNGDRAPSVSLAPLPGGAAAVFSGAF